MTSTRGFEPSDTTPVYVISIAAELSGLHPQTLRQYDRLGLVSPERASSGRRYSLSDIQRLRRVQALADTGLNLEGIRRVMALEDEVARLRAVVEGLMTDLDEHLARRREIVPLPERGGALVLYRSQPQ
jgi:MerR family transcriptional regulator/heat shock protein HspR